MPTSIGRASILLGVTDKVGQGLDAVYSRVSGFKNKINSFLSGGFAGSVGGKLFGDALSTTKDLANVGKAAMSIGASVPQYMGLAASMKKVGIEGDQVQGVFTHLSAAIGGASLGNEKFAKPIEQLGLNVDDLASKRPDQQFTMIADAIKGVESPAQKAYLAQKLFGDNASALMPILNQGSEGLQKMTDKSLKLGTALSETDMGKLTRAKDAIPKMEAVFSGAWNKMVVAMSPIIAGIGERLSALAERATPFIDVLVHGFETFWTIADGVLGEVFAWVEEIGQQLGAWVGGVTGSIDGFTVIDAVVRAVVKGVATAYVYSMQFGKSVVAVGAMIAGSVIEPLETVKDQIAGMLTIAGKIPGSPLYGLGDKLAGEFVKVDFAKLGRGMQDWAADAWNGWDNVGDRIKSVDEWMDRVLTKKQVFAKPDKAFNLLDLDGKDEKHKAEKLLGGALMAGSAAEYSARVSWDAGISSMPQKQLGELQQINQNTKAMLGKIGPGTPLPVF